MENLGPSDERRRGSAVDQQYRALCHEHRRRIVETLDRRRSASLDELADVIRNGTDSPVSTDRIRASLLHHLPALERAGAVEVVGPIVEARRAGLDALSNLLASVPDGTRPPAGSSGGAGTEDGPDDGGVEPASTARRGSQPPDRGHPKPASEREGSP